jgi:hypothetical protein
VQSAKGYVAQTERELMNIPKLVAYSMALASVSGLAPMTASADLNVPALSCQAPFLDQAEPMRWHEHYLMNPANNRGTWIVCPLPIESDIMNNTFVIGAFGNFIPGTVTIPPGEFPSCYVNIIDINNQHLEGYINNPGQRKIYSVLLQTQNPVNTLWSVASAISVQNVVNTIGQSCTNPADCWGVSINCYLPSGYALNMASQW